MPPTMVPPAAKTGGSPPGGIFLMRLIAGSIGAPVFLGAVFFSGGTFLTFGGVAHLEAAFIFLEGGASRTDEGVFRFGGDTFSTGPVAFEVAPLPTDARFFGETAVGGAAAPAAVFFALVPLEFLFSRNRCAAAFFGETFAVAFFAMGVPLHW